MHRSPWGVGLFFVFCFFVRATEPLTLAEAEATIDEAILREYVGFLAADRLAGRDSGSPGLKQAAAFASKHFAQWGLQALGDVDPQTGERSYLQRFVIQGEPALVANSNQLVIHTADSTYTHDGGEAAWLPFRFTANVDLVKKDVVFVGYGIVDEAKGYDDYAGIDVTDKIVLVLRYEPGEAGNRRYRPSEHAYLINKATVAREQGAAAMLLVNGPNSDRAGDDDPLFGLGEAGRMAGDRIAYAHIKRAVARTMFLNQSQDLAALQTIIDETGQPHSQKLTGIKVSLKTALERPPIETENVVAFLPGQNPAAEVVVFGAHYDHVGTGQFGSMWGSRGRDQIHNGADDNASGTSAVLAVAQALSQGPRPNRGVLFVLFAAEERGLLGSAHFLAKPPLDRARFIAMINADMIGRGTNGRLTIGGIATAPRFDDLVRLHNRDLDLNLRLDPSGKAPSDHMNFLNNDIPVLFYFTGIHSDYHTPDDDVEAVVFSSLATISRHIFRTLWDLAEYGVD